MSNFIRSRTGKETAEQRLSNSNTSVFKNPCMNIEEMSEVWNEKCMRMHNAADSSKHEPVCMLESSGTRESMKVLMFSPTH